VRVTITLAELHAALIALRYPPLRRSNSNAGASGHYAVDQDAYAKAIVTWIIAERRKR